MNEVTRILSAIDQGNPQAAEQLLPLVYDELRRLAAQRLAHENPNQTLERTALVHEAWLRLVTPAQSSAREGEGSDRDCWQHRGHFFAAAAEAMRRILVENARRKARIKHGGLATRLKMVLVQLATAASPDQGLLDLHDALDRLAAHDPVKAKLVELRSYTEALATYGIASYRTGNPTQAIDALEKRSISVTRCMTTTMTIMLWTASLWRWDTRSLATPSAPNSGGINRRSGW
jgi:RNA polymerase sigma factor (TIGR02999 family)